jgi:tRNA(Phe) wybutosine-synthesizing methylase Tyw3
MSNANLIIGNLPVLFTAEKITALTAAEDYYVVEIKKRLAAIEEKIGQQLFDTLEIEYIEVLFQHGNILDQALFQRLQYIKDNLEKQQSIGLYKDNRMYSSGLAGLEYFLRAVGK